MEESLSVGERHNDQAQPRTSRVTGWPSAGAPGYAAGGLTPFGGRVIGLCPLPFCCRLNVFPMAFANLVLPVDFRQPPSRGSDAPPNNSLGVNWSCRATPSPTPSTNSSSNKQLKLNLPAQPPSRICVSTLSFSPLPLVQCLVAPTLGLCGREINALHAYRPRAAEVGLTTRVTRARSAKRGGNQDAQRLAVALTQLLCTYRPFPFCQGRSMAPAVSVSTLWIVPG